MLTSDTKEALTDYYDAVRTLCEAQQNFAKSTQVLEKKIADKSDFLDIIKQVQLPSVKVEIRTVEEMERIEGKTYRELTLMCHLPNFKRINPNTKEQTRTMATYMYCVLHEQITGTRTSQTGCATDFKCQKTPFKRLITGKRQPGRTRQVERGKRRVQQKPGRCRRNGRCSTGQENKEGNQISNSNKSNIQRQRRERQIVRRLSKPSEQIGKTGRVDKNLRG